MKILFVEDDKIIAAGLCYSLQQEGYDVTHCLGVESARAALNEQSLVWRSLIWGCRTGAGMTFAGLSRQRPISR